MTNEEKLKKWIKGSLTKEEEEAFKQTEEFKSLQKILKTSQAFTAPAYDVEEELERLNERKQKGKVVKADWLKPALQVAAAIFLVAVMGYFLLPNKVSTIETLAGEKIDFYLPDSSHVTLNAKSTISYVKDNWNNERKVTLEGEAFFEVAKGSKFDVTTTSGTVSVLGTKFNVKDRENLYEVKCFEGLVMVDSEKGQIKLPADRGLQIINGQLSEFESLTHSKPTWITNMSSFSSAPFKQVIEEFERQYDVKVELSEEYENNLFSGSFIHSDMELALRSITLPLNLSYRIVDKHSVIITGK